VERRTVSYVIASYGLVIGTLVIYAWRVQSQRRSLMNPADAEERDE
jgi:hypothetical protein